MAVKREDTQVEVLGILGKMPSQAEMVYWYAHPFMTLGMVRRVAELTPGEYDGVIIGDVGGQEAEYALKELLDIPVVCVGQACFLLAHTLGRNFSILTYNDKVAAWLERILREYGFTSRCVSIRPAGIELSSALSRETEQEMYDQLLNQAKRALADDHAEVIVNGSAGFVGLAERLRHDLPVPVVDPVEAGVKFAEMLVDLTKAVGLYHSKVSTWKGSPNSRKYLGGLR